MLMIRGFLRSMEQAMRSVVSLQPTHRKEEREDFAEVVSTYIISTDAQWNAILKKATIVDANGAEAKDQPGVTAIEKKLEIAKRYYKETFNVDLDKVRDTVIERENNVVSGSYNLTNLNY